MMETRTAPLEVTEGERKLMIELLEAEQHDLPHEIHHTRTASVREDLRRRAEMVEALIAKLRREQTGKPATGPGQPCLS